MFVTSNDTIINKDSSGISRNSNATKRAQIISNRINLRCRIRTYLESENLFKKEREKAFYRYIRKEIVKVEKLNYKLAYKIIREQGIDLMYYLPSKKPIVLLNRIKAFFFNL